MTKARAAMRIAALVFSAAIIAAVVLPVLHVASLMVA